MNNTSIFGEEEIVLAPPTELLDEAKEISLNTIHDEKFPFVLHYNPNQKNFLLSLLGAVCAIVEDDNEDCHTISTQMNMTQLAFIKRSNCIECVKTDEGTNPFIAEDDVNLSADTTTDGVAPKTIIDSLEVQNELATPLSINSTSEAITLDGSASSVAASVLSSCDSHPANTDMDRAQVISANSTAEGCICCPGFEQWFKFTAPASKKYTICTVGDLDTVGTLYDCNRNQIASNDDYEPCGKINFRIIRNLTSGNTYYIKVGTKNNEVGSYTLRVTDSVLANSVNINKSSITLEKGVRYELPITPNYTYKGYMGARPIPELSISIDPSNATEQKIWWWEQHSDILECYTDWDDDGDRYFHVTTKKTGTTKLYAMDWKEHGKRDECSVVVTSTVTEPVSIKKLRIKSSSSVNVAIKENPSDGSETVGYIANNTIVDLIDAEPQNTKWYKIYWKDSNGAIIVGWCSGEYLEEKKIIYVVTYEDGIIGRDNPSNNYKQIASFFPGSWIIPIDNRLYGENNNYYRIKWLDTGITPCKYIDCYVTNDETCYTIDRQWMPLIANNVSYMGIEMIKNLEGFSESAIPDSGKYSIGYGHNIQDGGTTVTINGENYSIITKSLANQLLTEDLNSLFVPAFNSFLQNNNIVLNQNQYDACIIDCYQKGKNIWNNQQSDISIFIKDKTNFDNWQEVLDAFLDGVQVGDANYIRRYREAGLFLYWYYWKEIPTRGQST